MKFHGNRGIPKKEAHSRLVLPAGNHPQLNPCNSTELTQHQGSYCSVPGILWLNMRDKIIDLFHKVSPGEDSHDTNSSVINLQ